MSIGRLLRLVLLTQGCVAEEKVCKETPSVRCQNLMQKATHIDFGVPGPVEQHEVQLDRPGRTEAASRDKDSSSSSLNMTAQRTGVQEQGLDQNAMLKLLLCGLTLTLLVILVATAAISCHAQWQQQLPKVTEGLTSPLNKLKSGSKPIGPQTGPPLSEAQVVAGILPLFESNVARSPTAACLLDGETGACVSYQQVQSLSLCLATDLRQADLGDGDVAALLLEPSRRLVVAMLGCMQARVCWVPLDLKSPIPRLRHLLDRAGCALAFAAEDWTVDTPAPVWLLNDLGEALRKSKPRLPVSGSPHPTGNGAIFFTSGSTGDPKPVMYSRTFLCHNALSAARLCSADARTVFLLKTPTVWSVIVYEVFAPLTAGARAVVDARAQRDIVRLQRTITDYGVAVLFTSAPVLQLLADERLPSLRHAINIGAGLPLEVCRAVQNSFGRSLSIHNMYGCTETPCLQWTYDSSVVSPSKTMAPAGTPQPAVEVHLLDPDLKPVLEGDVGEIWIGGPYLSSGYLGDAKMTEARYIRNVSGNGLMYKTGDLGRWVREATGTLVLHVEGRIDRQLNINGVRVAPEEVEAVLSQAPGVKEVALVVAGGTGKEKMVAWACGEQEGGLKEAILSHSLEQLPLHMRPSIVLLLPHLPRLGNGKVDLVQLAKKAEAEMPPDDDDAVSAVDSLGRMKVVKRQALYENKVMSAARCLAALTLLLFHWYWARFSDFAYVIPERKGEWLKQGPEWYRAFIAGVVGVNGWSMSVFATVSGFDDSREAASSMVVRNCVALALYLFCYFLPWFYKMVAYHVFQSPDLGMCYYDGSPRWYFAFYILCNLLHSFVFLPMRTAAKRVSSSMALLAGMLCLVVLLPVCWWMPVLRSLSFFNPCVNGLLEDQSWSESEVFAIRMFMPNYSNGYCPYMIRPHESWVLMQYSVAWWLGPPLVDRLRQGLASKILQFLGPLPWMAAFFGSCFTVGYLQLRCGFPESTPKCLWPSFMEDSVLLRWVSTITAYFLLMAVALASRYKRFPLETLAWLGNFSLSVYVFHYGFAVNRKDIPHHGCSMRFFTLHNNITLVPPPEDVVEAVGSWPGSSFAKLALLALYTFVWTATIGRFFQAVLLSAMSASQKAIKRVT